MHGDMSDTLMSHANCSFNVDMIQILATSRQKFRLYQCHDDFVTQNTSLCFIYPYLSFFLL